MHLLHPFVPQPVGVKSVCDHSMSRHQTVELVNMAVSASIPDRIAPRKGHSHATSRLEGKTLRRRLQQ